MWNSLDFINSLLKPITENNNEINQRTNPEEDVRSISHSGDISRTSTLNSILKKNGDNKNNGYHSNNSVKSVSFFLESQFHPEEDKESKPHSPNPPLLISSVPIYRAPKRAPISRAPELFVNVNNPASNLTNPKNIIPKENTNEREKNNEQKKEEKKEEKKETIYIKRLPRPRVLTTEEQLKEKRVQDAIGYASHAAHARQTLVRNEDKSTIEAKKTLLEAMRRSNEDQKKTRGSR